MSLFSDAQTYVHTAQSLDDAEASEALVRSAAALAGAAASIAPSDALRKIALGFAASCWWTIHCPTETQVYAGAAAAVHDTIPDEAQAEINRLLEVSKSPDASLN